MSDDKPESTIDIPFQAGSDVCVMVTHNLKPNEKNNKKDLKGRNNNGNKHHKCKRV